MQACIANVLGEAIADMQARATHALANMQARDGNMQARVNMVTQQPKQ